jgi:alkanesulfonate monooxygenase SsuD/methylene tetrahydromethanopterin reductase-like flavin-dependent oxidoreductase (luciferase family)
MARIPRLGLELPPLPSRKGSLPALQTVDLVALARAVEAAGLGALWLVEGTARGLDPMPLAGSLARTTTTLGIGVLVRPALGRHPSVVARDVCALDRLSGGRALVGLSEADEAELDRLAEAARLLARLVREPAVSAEGPHYRVDELTIRPRPLRPGGPPVVVAAATSEAGIEAARASGADAVVVTGSADDVKAARRRVMGASGPALLWRGVLPPVRGTAQARSLLESGADGLVAVLPAEAAPGGATLDRSVALGVVATLRPLAGGEV